MDDSVTLWWLPAIWLLVIAQDIARSRSSLNLVFTGVLAVLAAYLVITFTLSGSRPSAGLVVVTAFAVIYLATAAVRQRVVGVDVFLEPEHRVRGVWTAARVRGRVDRQLRRRPDDVSEAQGPGAPLVAAARDAGGGDVTAAVARLDRLLASSGRPQAWPDATLGLILYHRTVYSALATAVDDSPTQSVRWRNDVDLARTLLPDLRLGWLCDAAVAWAEDRVSAAAASANAVRRHPRGRWEKDLAMVIGHRWDRPDPYASTKVARATSGTAWIDGLAARLVRIDAPAGPPT